LLALFLFMVVGALLETFMIGAIYPFISILNSPEIIQTHWILQGIYNVMSMDSAKEFITWGAVALIFAYIFKNAYLVGLTYAQSRFIWNKWVAFCRRLFHFYLFQPYTFHLQRNTAELMYKLNNVTRNLFSSFLFNLITVATETITFLFILSMLIWVSPLPSILTIGIVGMALFVYYRLTMKKISVFSKTTQQSGEQMVQCINQGLGGLKEAKVLGREDFFLDAYDKNSANYARAQRFVQVLNQLPRPFLETISVVCMLSIILLMVGRNTSFQSIIPTMSLFAVAAFRVIPSMNRIFAAATTIRFNSFAIEVLYNDLTLQKPCAEFISVKKIDNQKRTEENPALFNSTLELKEVSYQYPNAKTLALKDVSLIIQKNQVVGLVGPSGAGKTTIVDIMLGLLIPTEGTVLIDGRNIHDNLSGWQRRIGYIPQSIYLSDDTIKRNIAFGLSDEQIDEDRVWSVLQNAQLDEFVNSLPNKLDTFVGERGIRLSGGQRQRIGIARALYHDPEVLIMDEGTASLDNETERGVMKAVGFLSGSKTIIIIAHRLSTIKDCDQVYFINKGTVVDYGPYNELFEKSAAFQSMVMSANY